MFSVGDVVKIEPLNGKCNSHVVQYLKKNGNNFFIESVLLEPNGIFRYGILINGDIQHIWSENWNITLENTLPEELFKI